VFLRQKEILDSKELIIKLAGELIKAAGKTKKHPSR
jgi:hypothetical protein